MCSVHESSKLHHILGFLCSKVRQFYMEVINTTLNIQPGNMAAMPVLEIEAKKIEGDIIKISKFDWDS